MLAQCAMGRSIDDEGMLAAEEFLFEISQDKLSAQRQISTNKKLLAEAEASDENFKICIELAETASERERWERNLEDSIELQMILKKRITVLEKALLTFEKAVRIFRN